jgi:hypothetical protein
MFRQSRIIGMTLALLLGCADSKNRSHWVLEHDAQLISLAREAAAAAGFSLTDAIYQVRRDGDGWIVEVDKAPGYRGDGKPSVIVDSGFFVKFNSKGAVSGILSNMPGR